MATDKRPLSPHLQVYKPQLTSVLSIMHRATGVVLSVGSLLLVYWLISAAIGPEAYEKAQHVLGSMLGLLVLFGWTWALFYHLCNGIRHLYWDSGRGYDIPTAYKTGKMVLATSAALTFICWVIAV
ncbi:succinate dehydrogenase, cytochrome b556 subunit [Plasticicumulans acidivorans]|uniref:Succinate dehydrogenase cytochrome b556 subunit n=1 Tax=Plasticicumulans acidivorans TaxID=886464 RepID=A0A317MXY6_9GAMM|nr:succinate dehydrogenase, cytochrome b556 subunit [Plasticicumulans acidivorans]PWV63384.1 succinate dehydrogenase subunit C [Plasticicumulans acidivorans]